LDGTNLPSTSVVIPTLNEAERVTSVLAGLRLQREPVVEILVVDSGSSDGTRSIIELASVDDPRIQALSDPPLPPGWIGKAWAMEFARSQVRGDWILNLDADTRPNPGMVAGAVSAALREGFGAVSFSPRFGPQPGAQRLLHPAMLATLIYRFGPPGSETKPTRTLANGQCFLVRRDVLDAHGGYTPVRASFAEDVSLARHLAQAGVRVGFLDGSQLYDARAHDSLAELWREWGRSIDLKDATTPVRQVLDVAFLTLVQALPMIVLGVAVVGVLPSSAAALSLVWLNSALLAIRVALGAALAPSYARRGILYWLSPLVDPLAVLRVAMSSLRRPTSWRGRDYEKRARNEGEERTTKGKG
jgi:dolichol-phosphate mannosyltransferase